MLCARAKLTALSSAAGIPIPDEAKINLDAVKQIIFIKKKSNAIERHSKGQFSEIRHISKKVCRILRLCPQMQCLSGKLTSYTPGG